MSPSLTRMMTPSPTKGDDDSATPAPRPPSHQAVAALRESHLAEGSDCSEGFLDRLEQLGGTPNVQDILVFDPVCNVLLPPNLGPADRARAELEHHGRVRLLRHQQFIASQTEKGLGCEDMWTLDDELVIQEPPHEKDDEKKESGDHNNSSFNENEMTPEQIDALGNAFSCKLHFCVDFERC